MNNKKIFSIKEKANIASLLIMILASLFMVTNAFLGNSVYEGFRTIMFTLPCIVLVYFLIKKTGKNSDICAYVIPLIILGASIYYIISSNGCPQSITLMTMSCFIALLYFNQKIILIINSISFASTILLQLFLPRGILGEQLQLSTFITLLLFQLITLIILQCTARWGNIVLCLSEENLKDAEETNLKIQSTIETIDSAANVLNDSIKNLNESVDATKKETNTITKSIDEINESIESQGSNVDAIVTMVENASTKADHTLSISTELENLSNKMNKSTKDNMKRMNNTFEQMTLIKNVISTTSETAQDLQSTMHNISSVLEGIKNISEQTNLLSLNASIEAARAGIHGKGFAVVASEVSKLAAESKQLANTIESSLNELINKTNEVTVQAEGGQLAALKGEEILKTSLDSFKEMSENYTLMNRNISIEFENIQEINSMFKNITDNIHNISAITEEQISKTNEILISQTNAESQMEKIVNFVNNVSQQCHTLNQLTNNN